MFLKERTEEDEAMQMHSRLLLPALALALLGIGSTSAPSAPPETKTPPWELAKAKVDAARKAYLSIAQEFLEGKATVEQVHQWSVRWLNAQRDVSSKKPDQITALEGHIARMQQLEKDAKEKYEGRRGPVSDMFAAEYHRVDAELTLSKTKSSR